MANSTISSLQLEKILEVNSKAIEINTIVSSQFDEIIGRLEDIRNSNKVHSEDSDEIYQEIKQKQQDFIDTNNKVIMQLSEMNTKIQTSLVEISSKTVTHATAEAEAVKHHNEMLNKIDRGLLRLTIIVTSSGVGTILAILYKIFGGN